MNRILKPVALGAGLFIVATIAMLFHIVAWTEARATKEVCGLIRKNYYKADDENVVQFLDLCNRVSYRVSFSREKAIRNINARLSAIRTSHLMVYSPSENRRLWEHEGTDTGIRARQIDGETVIVRVLDESPAQKAGLRAGDAVVSINAEANPSVDEARETAGQYLISRGKEFLEITVGLETISDDRSPELLPLAAGAGLLKLPSFLPQYFEKEEWLRTASMLPSYRSLVVDLRENPGGSFPAMLRALSPFICDQKEIGRITRAGASESSKVEILDDLSAESQLEQLDEEGALILKTYPQYPCYKGKVLVLVDDETSSVAEIFAYAIMKEGRAKVWGSPSAGQVVMARWFPIGSLGGGDFAISIPIAGYRARDGAAIESTGVLPERNLNYDLASALRGEDSWVKEASLDVSK